ncbi:hypothetical protein [Paenirhodobacter populi]|uniref:Uncharacterized protein n=1 Tax=Paenirhodobacter populi TaxID=2306993 RepID=A0A443JDW8_9RHOB|nr:hypothetical protein [Sinirhodobacter populi]RWR18543.1 hypothetical protein D2T30_16275 [Sinirhodobacter populi]
MAGKCTVTLLEDGASFRIARDAWFNDYPLEELDGWIDFYKQLRADHSKSLHSYDETIRALEDFAEMQKRRG